MDDNDIKVLSAMEYFLSRKKQIEQYIEGEHRWFGDSTSDDYTPFNNRPWYLDSEGVSKTRKGV